MTPRQSTTQVSSVCRHRCRPNLGDRKRIGCNRCASRASSPRPPLLVALVPSGAWRSPRPSGSLDGDTRHHSVALCGAAQRRAARSSSSQQRLQAMSHRLQTPSSSQKRRDQDHRSAARWTAWTPCSAAAASTRRRLSQVLSMPRLRHWTEPASISPINCRAIR